MTVHLEIPEPIDNNARLSRFAFAELVTTRNIPRYYVETELTQDLDYARGP